MAVPKRAWLDDRFVPFEEARIPLDDRGLEFGESLYEVTSITRGVPRLLEAHVTRMRNAAKELGLESGVPELMDWQRIVAALIADEGVEQALLYAQVTGGATPRTHLPEVAPHPTFFTYVTPFTFPTAADVARGIRAISTPDIRWSRRDLKTTMLLPAILAKREAKRRNADEALLVGASGVVHEGASSNVFIVERGELKTPAQSSDLLPGTMRPFVVECAREAGIDVRGELISLDRVAAADEVFICSTSQLVMPVVSLDERAVGNGRPGGIACDLAERIRFRFELP